MQHLNKAKLDPSSEFEHPSDIVNDNSLNTVEKIEILKNWENEEKIIAIAEEENMRPQCDLKYKLLPEIQAALRELENIPTTKPSKNR